MSKGKSDKGQEKDGGIDSGGGGGGEGGNRTDTGDKGAVNDGAGG